ncbi:MAG: MFS transporter [Candidatus Lokiarchaeota archaeon]|nr:MFS transporter [Candidatus Harpocratesius repetitus]
MNSSKRIFSRKIVKFCQILILITFLLIGATTVNLIPAIYSIVINYFSLPSLTYIMFEEAIFILIGALISLIWGYLIDKIHRKRILQGSLIFFIIGLIFCTMARKFPLFLTGRIITAIGYGALIPIIYSLLADYISAKYWSTIFGILAFVNALGNVSGNFLSGFITPINVWNLHWKFSFVILSIITVILFVLLLFFQFPERGASSVELFDKNLGEQLREGNLAYPFRISRKDFKIIWKRKTNRNIVILSFFAVIPGAIMSSFLVFYLTSFPFASFPDNIRIQISQIFAAAAGAGYFIGTLVLGPIFDLIHRKSPRLRAHFTYLGIILAIPLFILAFLVINPVEYSNLEINPALLNNTINPILYFKLITSIFFFYPAYSFYFLALFFGSFFVASITINRTPTLLEVNLPEHMGTSQAMLHFSDQFGKGFTYMFIAFQYYIYEFLFHVVNGKLLLILSILWYFIPLWLWRNISKEIEVDSKDTMEIIAFRSKDEKFVSKIKNNYK